MTVIVLFGGDGSEHRVSVASAQNIARELSDPALWYWTRSGTIVDAARKELLAFDRPFERDFTPELERRSWTDVASAIADDAFEDTVFFLALHGGSGENGTLQEALETLGRPFTGSGAAASRLAFDKLRARERVASRGVRVAEASVVNANSATHERLGRLFEEHEKLVIKPIADGSSHGVRIIETERDLDEAIRTVSRDDSQPYFAEAFVSGRELTVGVLQRGGRAEPLPCSEIRLDAGRTFDYEGKYLGQGTVEITPAPVSDDVSRAAQRVAVTAHEAIGCEGYSRTDVIASDDGPVFLEINTLPGLTARSFFPQQLEAAGLPFGEFLSAQIELARARRSSASTGR